MDEKKVRKQYKEQIEKVYQEQLKEFLSAIRESKKILADEIGPAAALDAGAVIAFGSILFQLKLGKKQNLAQVERMIQMQKLQEKMKQSQGKNEVTVLAPKKSPCAGCSACRP